MCRKKKLFIILCICFSLSACGKKEQEFRNNKISSEYTQNEDDHNHNKANSDQVQSQNTGKEGADVNDNSGLQIDTEKALVCGNVDELIENGCILKIGIENNDEYAMPVGEEQKKEQKEEQIIYDSNIQVFVEYYEKGVYEEATLEDIKKNTFIYVFGEEDNNSIIADQIVILRITTEDQEVIKRVFWEQSSQVHCS